MTMNPSPHRFNYGEFAIFKPLEFEGFGIINPVEFDGIRIQTGLNSFVLTPKPQGRMMNLVDALPRTIAGRAIGNQPEAEELTAIFTASGRTAKANNLQSAIRNPKC